jgi:SAM-dependent methyltransferase
MSSNAPPSTYLLGGTNAEHERLIRQSAIFDPFTERLFRDAGISAGQRVLDIGSGLGDVAMLAARLVGPTGTVLGVDRDAHGLDKARARVAEAGLGNVTFAESDISQLASGERFNAVVGRLILQFLPDSARVVRSLAGLLRPGGVLAIQDSCWNPLLWLAAHLPLRSKVVSLIHQSFERSGAHMNMERVLYRTFQEAGLPAPSLRIDLPVGDDTIFARWAYDLFLSLQPRMEQHGLAFGTVGNLEILLARLQAEGVAEKMFGSSIGLVGAWSRKPGTA